MPSSTANKVEVLLSVNAASYSAALDKAQRKLLQFGSTAATAGSHAKQFGNSLEGAGRAAQHSVSGTQAASASIRVLEGNLTNSVRAAENFVSRIPGVSAALKVAFPVVGAIALAGVIGELGEKIYKFIHQIDEVPSKLRDAFTNGAQSIRASNDALQTSIDKTNNEIALLEHKQPNLLAVELDRSKEEADKLASSLHGAADQYKSLIKAQSIGAFGGLLTLNASTTNTSGTVQYYKNQQATIADQLATARDAGDKAQADALSKQLDASRKSEEQWLAKDLASQKSNNVSGNWLNRFIESGIKPGPSRNTEANQTLDSSEIQSLHDAERQQALQAQSDAANDKKDALEAGKQAAADRLTAMQHNLELEKAQYQTSIAQDLAYWTSRISTFTKGSEQYNSVLKEIFTLQAALYAKDLTVKKSYTQKVSDDQKDSLSVLATAGAAVGKLMSQQANDVLMAGSAWKSYHDAVTQAAEIENSNAASLAEASLRMEEMTGRISTHDAALQQAAIHTKQYQDAIAALAAQHDQISADKTLTPAARAAGLQDNANATARATGQYQMQQVSDNAAINGSTMQGSMADALNVMVQQWTDMTQALASTLTQTVGGLNDDLAKAMTGQGGRGSFKDSVGRTLQQGAQGLAKTGLEKAEGSVMKAFGIGSKKPTGTASDPIHTISVTKALKAGATDLGGLLGKVGSAISTDAGKVGGFFKKILGGGTGAASGAAPGATSGAGGWLSALSGILPGLAGGGDVIANHPYITSEKGPELFVPRTDGRIIPNGQFGNTSHNISIDARGATDPASTEAAVHRAMSQYMPQMLGMSVAAVANNNKRKARAA